MRHVRPTIVSRALLLLALAAALCASFAGSAARAAPLAAPDLGPNVIVFDPSMPVSQIQVRSLTFFTGGIASPDTPSKSASPEEW